MKYENTITALSLILVFLLLCAAVKAIATENRTEARWNALKDAFAEWFLMPAKETIIKETTTELTTGEVVKSSRDPCANVNMNRGVNTDWCDLSCNATPVCFTAK